ncbi:hypothetical protein UO65_4110 [Actinokineospora spheciospongiae]|uniref:Secreted protein n=1 Tax=Actinokineospora spheciospongiae TaxID=909613 RepID=W7IW03_9PSEU|nr:hypothetical protein [Actinokineospora spheciospongiae]EWC60611.1 hypothetical protein UO65_4110 [Actinokineospora spheciospongiae]PWW65790.1 hypothetical protein DFQ13_102545 [Actinokineospora spheciospongiae]
MKKALGRLGAVTVIAGSLLGFAAGTASAGNPEYIRSYQRQADCERAADEIRSGADLAAYCTWDKGHTEWDLFVLSL